MSKNKKKNTALLFVGLTVLISISTIFLYTLQPRILKELDFKIYDLFLQTLADENPNPTPVILDIDEKSLIEFGQWPWPRYRLALIIQTLIDYGAAAVALDIVLAEPDRTSPYLLQENMKKELGLEVDFSGLPPELMNNDALLASTLQGLPVVLGSYIQFSEQAEATEKKNETIAAHASKIVEFKKPNAIPALDTIYKANSMTLPIDILLHSSHIGFFNMGLNQDGLVRAVPLVLQIDGKVHVNLAVQALMLATKAKHLRLNTNENGLESIGIGKHTVLVSPQGLMNVPYRGASKTFPYISAADFLEGKISPDMIENKIVFIGTSAPGLLDIRSVPLDSHFPGVEVHATIIDAILSNRSIITPPWTPGLQLFLMLLLTVISFFTFTRVTPVFSVAVIALLSSLCFGGSFLLFQKGFYISPLWLILLIGELALCLISLRFWREEKDKRMIRQVFSRYVSPEIVSRIVEKGEATLKGEERELTVMFTDLRGFTSISEKLHPEQVVSLLNRYFTPMTALVRHSEGTLDKFIGDSIMAFWNAPLDVENHCYKAVNTALTMLETLNELNTELKKDFNLTLNMGAGIHTGLAYVGNMGSLDLTSYTAIGDTVNLASRLEGLCSKYGFRTIISGETAEKCNFPLQKIAKLKVKGRKEAVNIFNPLSEQDLIERREELEQYNAALNIYDEALNQQDHSLLKQSKILFEKLALAFPSRLLYYEYSLYCSEMSLQKEWNGIWTLTNK